MSGPYYFLRGIWLLPRGARFLLGHRFLWPAALAPLGINVVCFALSLYLAFSYVRGLVDRLVPAEGWYWLALGYLGAIAAFILSVAVGIIVFFAVASVLAGPFNDWLGTKTLALLGHKSPQADVSLFRLLRLALRGVKESVKEAGYFLAISAAFLLLGFIPLVGLAAPFLTALFLWYSLAFSAVVPSLSERNFSFREKRIILSRNRWATFGYGFGCFLMLVIPLAGLFFFPVAVVGGALLYHEVLSSDRHDKRVLTA
jgi:CysZ protein